MLCSDSYKRIHWGPTGTLAVCSDCCKRIQAGEESLHVSLSKSALQWGFGVPKCLPRDAPATWWGDPPRGGVGGRVLTAGRIWDCEMMLFGRLLGRLSVVASAQVTWKPVAGRGRPALLSVQEKCPVMLASCTAKEADRCSGLACTLGRT